MKDVIALYIDALVKFCTDKVEEALWPDGPTGEEYLNGLVRVNHLGVTRGSHVDGLDTIGKTLEFLRGLDGWQEFAPVFGMKAGCRYYRTECPDVRAWQEVVSLEYALRQCGRLEDIAIEDGPHGKELVWTNTIIDKIAVGYITLIEEGGMMSTWFPGQVFAAIPQDLTHERMLEEWKANPNWAVKLVRKEDKAMLVG